MKKQTFILAGFLIGAIALGQSSNAQSDVNFFKKERKALPSQEKARKILNVQKKSLQNKPAAIQERVIAQSFYDMEFQTMEDSTHYVYLGTRGSQYNYNDLDFAYNSDLDNDRQDFSDLFINNTALADTVKNYENGTGALTNYYTGYYRPDNQLDSIIYGFNDGTAWVIMKTNNTFNATGHLIESERIDVTNNTINYKKIYSYNNDFSQVVADSSFIYTPNPELNQVFQYSYGANNKIDSIFAYYFNGINIYLNDITVLKYHPDGKIKEQNTYETDSTSLQLYEINRYTHHTTVEAPATWEQLSYYNGLFTDSLFVHIQLGTNGFPDSLKATITDVTNNVENILVTMEYNAANNPVRVQQTYDSVQVFRVNYYYEDYNDSITSIKSIPNNFAEVFPNPFKESLNIILKETSKSISEISLTDVLGRQVFSQKHYLNAGNNLISVPEIPGGLYMLNIKNPEIGQISKKLIKE